MGAASPLHYLNEESTDLHSTEASSIIFTATDLAIMKL